MPRGRPPLLPPAAPKERCREGRKLCLHFQWATERRDLAGLPWMWMPAIVLARVILATLWPLCVGNRLEAVLGNSAQSQNRHSRQARSVPF